MWQRERGEAVSTEEELPGGPAWHAFCSRLERVGHQLAERKDSISAAERSEGVPYLLGLVNSAIQIATRCADTDHPHFIRNPDSVTRWGAETADCLYLFAGISGTGSYVVRGNRNSVQGFYVEVKEGFMQLGETRIFASLSDDEIDYDADGTFEILLCAERPPDHEGNWMPLHSEARIVGVWQFFGDWETERQATFEIIRPDSEGSARTAMSPRSAAAMLDTAASWIEASATTWSKYYRGLVDALPANTIVPPRNMEGGPPMVAYGTGHYELEGDQALIVECEVPAARWWSFQLADPWFTAMEYASHQTSINHRQATIDADGRVRCVVAHSDPGVPNWLDASGHEVGLLQVRWVWSEDNPQPTVRKVPLSSLREHLPAETPTVTEEERRRAISHRQRHVARRESAT